MMLPTPVILIIHETDAAREYANILDKIGGKVHVATSFEDANELLSFLLILFC